MTPCNRDNRIIYQESHIWNYKVHIIFSLTPRKAEHVIMTVDSHTLWHPAFLFHHSVCCPLSCTRCYFSLQGYFSFMCSLDSHVTVLLLCISCFCFHHCIPRSLSSPHPLSYLFAHRTYTVRVYPFFVFWICPYALFYYHILVKLYFEAGDTYQSSEESYRLIQHKNHPPYCWCPLVPPRHERPNSHPHWTTPSNDNNAQTAPRSTCAGRYVGCHWLRLAPFLCTNLIGQGPELLTTPAARKICGDCWVRQTEFVASHSHKSSRGDNYCTMN